MRYSKQRENVKKGLEKFCIHPTAEELYLELKPNNANLSLATVYRNLNQLAESGQIKKIEGLSGRVHYDHNNHEHFHIICVNCGKVADLGANTNLSFKLIFEKESQFEVLSYDIVVKGLCSKCKGKLKKGNSDGN